MPLKDSQTHLDFLEKITVEILNEGLAVIFCGMINEQGVDFLKLIVRLEVDVV